MTWEIRQGNSLDLLREMPADSVDCCVTSPPYFGLRQYMPDDAMVLRSDLTAQETAYVLAELEKAGVPKC